MKNLAILCLCTLYAVAVHSADLKVGDPAPEFTLQGSDGNSYTLSQFKGKQAVVLAWFPRAFTSGCTVECKSLADNGDKIRQYDVTYFMASVDPLKENISFSQSAGADFPLLSDPSREVAKAYGVLQGGAFARRVTFYIGIDGTVLRIDSQVNPSTSAQDMVATLGELGVARAK